MDFLSIYVQDGYPANTTVTCNMSPASGTWEKFETKATSFVAPTPSPDGGLAVTGMVSEPASVNISCTVNIKGELPLNFAFSYGIQNGLFTGDQQEASGFDWSCWISPGGSPGKPALSISCGD
jgi:hypothetical protein